jgi:hypothetical protein
MRAAFTALLLLLLLPELASAQATIAGIVRDSLTRQPLPFASVFIANTTVGVTTTEQGTFVLGRVAVGTYDVVASYVGYRLAKQTVTVGTAPQQLTLELAPASNRLGEVVVRAHPTRLQDYQHFAQLFLGETTFSKQCRIRNSKDLTIDFNKNTQELTASTDNYLQVDNQAMGYHIKYYGLRFRCNLAQQFLSFYGEPVFEEMKPRDERQQKRWEANRAIAYHGSLTHFLKSVYDNRVVAEGFLAQKIRIIRNLHYPRADSLARDLLARHNVPSKGAIKQYTSFGSVTTPLSAAEQDSLQHWYSTPKAFSLLYPAQRPVDSLRYVSADGSHTFLRFTDELQVVYFSEKSDLQYKQFRAPIGPPGASAPAQREVSQLRLLVPKAELQTMGAPVNPLVLLTTGYWAFEKIGEFLPLNYVPPTPPTHHDN